MAATASTMMEDHAARICAASRELHGLGLVGGRAGNVSARLDDRRILITRAGALMGRLEPTDLVEVGAGAHDPSEGASTELPLHRACYAADPCVGAVVHTHAPALTAAGLRGLSIAGELPELASATGKWSLVGLVPSGSSELGREVGVAVAQGAGVVLLRGHGAVCVGASVDAAVQRTELAELSAYAVVLADSSRGMDVRARIDALIEVLASKDRSL